MSQGNNREDEALPGMDPMSKERIGQISTMIVQLGLRNGGNTIFAKIEDLPRALNISGEELVEYLETIESDSVDTP